MASILTTTTFKIPFSGFVGDSDSVVVRFYDGRVFGYYYYGGNWYNYGMKTTDNGASYGGISISGNIITANIIHSSGDTPTFATYIKSTTGQGGGNEP